MPTSHRDLPRSHTSHRDLPRPPRISRAVLEESLSNAPASDGPLSAFVGSPEFCDTVCVVPEEDAEDAGAVGSEGGESGVAPPSRPPAAAPLPEPLPAAEAAKLKSQNDELSTRNRALEDRVKQLESELNSK